MFFTYILKSKKDSKLYIGYARDLKKRFKEHNSGLVESTRSRKPFSLVYYESYVSKQDAVKCENNLKLRAKALTQLLKRISNSIKA